MKKILSLTAKDWLSGITQGTHIPSGLWIGASGINPFVNPVRTSTSLGALQAGPAVTDKTGAVVGETPIAWVTGIDGNSGKENLWFSTTGKFYSFDLSDDTGPTDRRTVANMANGLGTFQAAGNAQKYLYYWQKTQIGRFNLAATYDDDWSVTVAPGDNTGLQSTVHHPVHKFYDALFYGNKDRIGSIRDDGAADVVHATNDLDFESDYTVTTLSDDGLYLVIGMTNNIDDGANIYSGAKIRFWDTNSSSWEREWDLPAPDIISIKKVGIRMYALTSVGLFVFNFSTPPQLVYSLLSTDTAGVSSTTGSHHSMDVLGEGVLWGSGTRLHYYGKMIPQAERAYHQPFAVPSGTATMVASSAKYQKVFVGTTTPKFGYYDFSDSGTPDTGVNAESRVIDLGQEYLIGRIDVVLGSKLASGDSLNIGVGTGVGTTLNDFQSENAVSYTNYGATNSVKLDGSVKAEQFIIKPTFVGGGVKIKRIDVWGDPVLK
jgi:hypothetical protein